MTYVGDKGENSAQYRPALEVPAIEMRPGVEVRLIAPGSATRGDFGLFEWTMPARSGGPDGHFHRTFSESFYVTAGTVSLFNGERWIAAPAGDFLYVPPGGVHGFRNDTDEPASMLLLFVPGPARERYFEELAEIRSSGRELSYDEWTELYARHDQYRA